ncbi:MAG: alpha/beta hydrolase [Acidimicrobiales bacterium]
MASPQAEALKQLMRDFRAAAVGSADAAPPTVEEQRAGAAMSMEAMGVMPDGVTTTETSLAGLFALDQRPDGGADDRVVLYLHGGGYVVLSPRTHAKLSAGIAKAAGCRVVSVDYRLAPEHPHPAAVTDALAAYRALLDEGYAPHQVAISGDSAGGGLTLATLVAARDAGVPQPACAVPLSPWTDLEGTGESMDTKADDDLIVGRDGLKIMGDLFLAGGDARDPLAAPLYADLRGLAPVYVQVGGDETLLDDSTRFVARAAAAGVDVRLDVFPEMQHVFQSGLGMFPEADDAVARIGQYLRSKLAIG